MHHSEEMVDNGNMVAKETKETIQQDTISTTETGSTSASQEMTPPTEEHLPPLSEETHPPRSPGTPLHDEVCDTEADTQPLSQPMDTQPMELEEKPAEELEEKPAELKPDSRDTFAAIYHAFNISRPKLGITRLCESAVFPTRNHPEDAGLDLYAAKAACIPRNGFAIVGTGIAVDLPPSTYGRIAECSNLATSFGIRGGVIDCEYDGEVKKYKCNTIYQ